MFVSPWSKRAVVVPTPAVPGFERVDSIKALGITISRRFSIAEHVDNLLAACAQTLFAMRTLKQLDLPLQRTLYIPSFVPLWSPADVRFACLVGLCQHSWQGTTGSFSPSVQSNWVSRTISSYTSQYLRWGRRQAVQEYLIQSSTSSVSSAASTER